MKNVWFVSKYSRTPLSGEFPARSFSILRSMSAKGVRCTLFMSGHQGFGDSLFNMLAERQRLVDDVRVFCISTPRYRYSSSPARVFGWVVFELKLLILWLRLKEKPDIVVVSSLSLLSVLSGLIIKKVLSVPMVFEVRDIWPLILTENAGFSKWNPFVVFLAWVERLGYRHADQVVGTMPNLGRHVEKVLGFARETHCVPMGIPDEMLQESPREFPAVLMDVFPKAQFVLTYAGSVGMDNALEPLIAAAQILRDDRRFAIFIIGSGALLEDYKAVCRNLPNVVFADPVSSRDVQAVLRRSTALYFSCHPTPALDYGQSLNKLVDYMFSGTPIIGSYSGFPSMINEAGCGEFVPAGDPNALVALLRRWGDIPAAELQHMGERGRAWLLANRTYSTLADRYISILVECDGDR